MGDDTEKRKADHYEITQGIQIGDKEVVFGIDTNSEMPYFCGFYTSNELFASYTDCVVGNDYVEMIELFADRTKEQCLKVREERAKVTVPREKITKDMCFPLDESIDLTGKVAVIKEDSLRPEYRSSEYQLVLVTGGNSAHGNLRGRACFCTNLYTGCSCRWERYDIQGEMKPQCIPQWAKERLEELKEDKRSYKKEIGKSDKSGGQRQDKGDVR